MPKPSKAAASAKPKPKNGNRSGATRSSRAMHSGLMPVTGARRGDNHLKIGLVLDDTLDTPDGVQQYVLAVGAWLASQGHEVRYLVGQTLRTDVGGVHSLSRNVKVRFNGNRMSMPLPASKRRLRAFLKAEKFDVLHVQMPYSPLLAGRLLKVVGPQTAVVGTFHVAPQSGLVLAANYALGWWTRRTLKRFDHIASVSPVAQAFAEQTYGISSDVIPNTIDLTPFFAATPFPKYKDVQTIVFVGRLVERKGCQHLLRAVNGMRQTYQKPFRVIVCGRGPLDERLRAYVREHGLDDVVEFAGWIAEADKPRYIASADIAIYPSTGGESFGIVLIEAMAAARGITLAGDNPGYHALLADHPEVLFDPLDAEKTAALLAGLLDDPQKRAAAQIWQRAFARQFDAAVVGPMLVAMYDSALHKRRTSVIMDA